MKNHPSQGHSHGHVTPPLLNFGAPISGMIEADVQIDINASMTDYPRGCV